MKLEFIDRFSKNTQIPNFIEIRPVGANLAKLTAAFCNFAKPPNMLILLEQHNQVCSEIYTNHWNTPSKTVEGSSWWYVYNVTTRL